MFLKKLSSVINIRVDVFSICLLSLFGVTHFLVQLEARKWGPEGFKGKGILLVTFLILKIIFAILFLVGASGIGLLVEFNSSNKLRRTVLQLIFGLSIYTVLFTILGLLQMLKSYFVIPYVVIGIVIFTKKIPKIPAGKFSIRSVTLKASGVLFFTFSGFLLLIMKGLYPAGGHDYWTHYLPYQMNVAESGSLLPNEWWYHFFTSKGLVLLTSSLAISNLNTLVTPIIVWALVILTALGIVSLSHKSHYLWFPGISFIMIMCYTPGPIGIMRANGGWGDFGKGHEIAGLFVIGIIGVVIDRIELRQSGKQVKYLLSSICLALALISTPAAILLVAGLSVSTLVGLVFGRLVLYFKTVALLLLFIMFTFLINIRFFGLASDLFLGKSLLNNKLNFLFRPDLVDHYGALANVWASASSVQRSGGFSTLIENFSSVPLFIIYFIRGDYLGISLFILTIILTLRYFFSREWHHAGFQSREYRPSANKRTSFFKSSKRLNESDQIIIFLVSLLLGEILFSLLTISNDSDKISGYRGTASLLPIPCLLMGCMLEKATNSITLRFEKLLIGTVVCCFFASTITVWRSDLGFAALKQSAIHSVGITTTGQELTAQIGLSGRLPFGAINPDVRLLMGMIENNNYVYAPNLWPYNGLKPNRILYSGATTCWIKNFTFIATDASVAADPQMPYSGPKFIIVDSAQPIQSFDRILLHSLLINKDTFEKNWKIIGRSGTTILIQYDASSESNRVNDADFNKLTELVGDTSTLGTEIVMQQYLDFRTKLGLGAPKISHCSSV